MSSAFLIVQPISCLIQKDNEYELISKQGADSGHVGETAEGNNGYVSRESVPLKEDASYVHDKNIKKTGVHSKTIIIDGILIHGLLFAIELVLFKILGRVYDFKQIFDLPTSSFYWVTSILFVSLCAINITLSRALGGFRRH